MQHLQPNQGRARHRALRDARARRTYTPHAPITQQRYHYRSYLQIAALDLLTNTTKHTILWDPTQPTATRPLSIQQAGTWYTYKTPGGCKGGWTCAQHAPRRGEDSMGRVRINYRYYNPTDGRWTRRDPARYKRSINLLAYVNNQVAERWDVLGLFFSQNQDESLGIYREPISVYISATGSRSLATSTPHGSIQSLQDTIARKVKKCECIENLQLLIHGNPTGMVVKGRDYKEESEWITSDTVASVFSALKDSNGRSLFCPLCTIYLDSCHVGLGVIPSIIASTTGCMVRAPYGYSCGIPRFPEWSRAKAKPGKKPLLHEDLAPEEKQNHYGYFYPDGSESPGH